MIEKVNLRVQDQKYVWTDLDYKTFELCTTHYQADNTSQNSGIWNLSKNIGKKDPNNCRFETGHGGQSSFFVYLC